MSAKASAKSILFEQIASIGMAFSSPNRIELVDLLCQGEKSVDSLAKSTGMSMKLTSAHLQTLRSARLVESRREGKYVHYRMANDEVVAFWIALRSLSQRELERARVDLRDFFDSSELPVGIDRKKLIRRARSGEVIIIDVRPVGEFESGHLPFARSVPLDELKAQMRRFPKDREIVAYCRGPFCLLAKEAVQVLVSKGFRAVRFSDGVPEWRLAGLPIEIGKELRRT